MSIASLLLALIVTSAADTSGDPVLLDFQASWCGPCQKMRPAVEKLERAGYPIRSVDVDQSPDLKKRYNVESVPTFLVVDANGRALARTSGYMPASQLAAFYNQAKAKLGTREPVETASDRDAPDADAASEQPEGRSSKAAQVVNPLPWETVVRIKMHLSSQEWGFGSGTIIYSDEKQSIILTCAHIFKLKGVRQPGPKDFKVPITVDLFDGHLTGPKNSMVGCLEKDIAGEAIDYDFNNDVGLIRIRPGRRLSASQVVPDYWKPKAGMKMYAVGCSHGNDATAWDTTILDPQVNMKNTQTNQAFFEMKCANQPMEGRSGGGLYTKDGYVAGVCDFADPNEHVGLYAVPQAIHKMLDKNSLTALYKPSSGEGGMMLASRSQRATQSPPIRVRGQSPSEADLARSSGTGANPEDITIPPPNMVGISTPKVKPAAQPGKLQPWRGEASAPALAQNPRRTHRPAPAEDGESIDPNAPAGGTVTTNLAIEPEADAEPAPSPAARRPAPAIPTDPSRLGKWQPVRERPRSEVNAEDRSRDNPAGTR